MSEAARTYEFSPAQGAAFAALGVWLARAGALAWALAALFALLSVEAFVSLYLAGLAGAIFAVLGGAGLVVAAVAASVGRALRAASVSCRAVADTAGDDVTHVMRALRSMAWALGVLRAAAGACVGLVLVALAAHLR